MNKGFYLIILMIVFLAALVTIKLYPVKKPPAAVKQGPVNINVDGKMKVKYPQDYTLVLVGDSMTEYLGNSDELRSYLKNYYPTKSFEVLNYGFGSTNISSVRQRLTETTFYGREFRPILDIDFNLILIESFGHNPLSDYPLEEGLNKQTAALEEIVETIRQSNPKAKIVFVATIAPNEKVYAYRLVDLSEEDRKKWAKEREAYIKNHIEYARSHGIPLIDIFSNSLKDGTGNLDYISSTDYIHPSPTGVIFISRQIADFIYQNKLLE